MPELESSHRVQATVASHSVNTSLPTDAALPLLLTLRGYADLNPSLTAANQAEQERAASFNTALAFYQAHPSLAHGHALLAVLRKEAVRLETERTYALQEQAKHQSLAQQAASERRGYSLQSYYRWASHRVQDFFGSSEEALADKYAAMAERREAQREQVQAGIVALAEELDALEDAEIAEDEEHRESVVQDEREISLEEVTESMTEETEISLETPVSSSEAPESTPHLGVSRHVLQQTSSSPVTVLQPIPDQIVPIGQPYRYPLDQVFSGEYTLLGVTPVGQSSLPEWLNLQYRLLGSYPAGSGRAYDIAVSGSTVFVANGNALLILDISNPSTPRLLGNYSTGLGRAYGVAVLGSTAFVANGGAGLLILDVSNPGAPHLLGNYSAGSGLARSVAVSDSAVFVAYGPAGLLTLDVSNPSTPRLLGNYPAGSGQANDVAVSDNTVFVADGAAGLLILDVSNPGTPRLLGNYQAGTGGADGVAVSGSTVFVANWDALLILDVSTPGTPRLLGNYSADASGVATSDSTVFVTDGDALLILDVSTPGTPRLLGNYPTGSGIAFGVAVSDSTVFVTTDTTALLILDVSQGQLTGVPLNNPGEHVLLSVSARNFVTVLAETPVFTLTLDRPPYLRPTSVADQRVFPGRSLSLPISSTLFVNPGAAFLSLSIQSSDQSVPDWLTLTLASVLMGNYPAGSGWAVDVVVSGSTVLVANNDALLILDVSNPGTPRLLGHYPAGSGYAYGVAVSGSTVFVTNGPAGLLILDVSNPGTPRLLGHYPAGSGYAYGVAVSGSTAFVANWIAGLLILDVSNPGAPRLLGNYPAGSGAALRVAVSGSAVLVADGDAGLLILDVSHPSTPRLLGHYPAGSGAAFGIAISGSTVFMADGTAGLLILDVSQWVLTATPNTSHVGNYHLDLVATDAIGGSGRAPFTFSVEEPPQMSGVIPAQTAYLSQAFNYFIPQQLFVSPNNNPISFSVGGVLPLWLEFNRVAAAFSGRPTTVGNFNLTVVATATIAATREVAGSLNTTFLLTVESNPLHVTPPSLQTATVGDYFQYVASGVFTATNGLPLNYSAGQVGGLPLPAWLSFNNTEPPALFGVPRHGDTYFYAIRPLQIQLNTCDGIVNGTSILTINVGGTSWGELIIKVASPIVSVLTVVYGLYKGRALFYNHWHRHRFDHEEVADRRKAQSKYRQTDERKGLLPQGSHPWQPRVGEPFEFHLLEHFKLRPHEIWDVVVQVKSQRSWCARFWYGDSVLPLPYDKLSGGRKMPSWLDYDPEDFTLRSKGKVPEKAMGNLVVQVYGEDGLILKRFELNVIRPVALHIDQPPTHGRDGWLAVDEKEGKADKENRETKEDQTEAAQDLSGSPGVDVEMQTLSQSFSPRSPSSLDDSTRGPVIHSVRLAPDSPLMSPSRSVPTRVKGKEESAEEKQKTDQQRDVAQNKSTETNPYLVW